jgi:chromatin remodeling complex protein RSC6
MARYKPKSTFYYSHHLVRQQNGTKLRAGRRQRKRRVARRPNRGYQNLHRRFFVDDVLRAIIGRAMTTRPEAVRLVWNYIKRHNLQKPENGRIILPDQRLGALTGEPGVEFNGFKMMTHIQRHILPPHRQQ